MFFSEDMLIAQFLYIPLLLFKPKYNDINRHSFDGLNIDILFVSG